MFNNIHPGSWFGLPDFGITEAIGNLLGAPRTAQGGSNLLGSPSNAQVLDAKTQTLPNGISNNYAPAPIATTPSTPSAQTAPANPLSTAQTNVNSQAQALRDSINSGYNDLFGQYDQQAGLLPGWQQQDEASLMDAYNKGVTGLQSSLDNANKSIDLSKQQIQKGVDKSVSDIQNSLRTLLRNAQGQIGAVGAGNSSVANTLIPYAFSKMYAQQRGNIQGQANNQFTTLDQKALDVANQFNTQKMQLDQWEQGNLTATRDKYRNLLMQINNAKTTATGQRAQALEGLQQQLLTQAQNELAAIQQEAANQRQMVFQSQLQQQQNLNAAQQQMANTSQFTMNPLVYQALTGLNGGAGATNDLSYFNPMALAQKKDQNQNQ